jgi:hypothetical protein
MKKTLVIFAIALIAGLATSLTSYAAKTANHKVTLNLGESALISITTGDINLNLAGATVAGAAIATEASNDATRIRISSSVSTGKTRKLDVGISTGNIDGGSSIYVLAYAPAGFSGDPNGYGTPLAQVELDGLTKTTGTLINAIGTCWSGTDVDSGYQVKYTLNKPAGATFTNGRQVTVTYTLSEEI